MSDATLFNKVYSKGPFHSIKITTSPGEGSRSNGLESNVTEKDSVLGKAAEPNGQAPTHDLMKKILPEGMAAVLPISRLHHSKCFDAELAANHTNCTAE